MEPLRVQELKDHAATFVDDNHRSANQGRVESLEEGVVLLVGIDAEGRMRQP